MTGSELRLDTVDEALAAMRDGLPVLVVDAADRENEGDVIMAAQHATPQWVGWTIRHTSGLLCAPMTDARADELRLPLMVPRSEDPRRTAYTISVDARDGITTGISATDRSRVLRLLADGTVGPAAFIRPGHVIPLRARPGGVLTRPGHTEAAVDLCTAAGLSPVAVLAEVVGDDGEPLRGPALRVLADQTGLRLISIEDLVAWRRANDPAESANDLSNATGAAIQRWGGRRIQRIAVATLPTRYGDLQAVAYRDGATGEEHLALTTLPTTATFASTAVGVAGPLVRVHSECMTGDTLGSLRCDCGQQLDASLAAITADPHGGALVYLRGQEGRGIGLAAKIAAYALQDRGLDTVDANTAQGLPVDARQYDMAAAILVDLSMVRVRLLTNNPAKIDALTGHGIVVTRRVPMIAGLQRHNTSYLTTKRDRLGHLLPDNLNWLTDEGDDLSADLIGRSA